MKRKLISNEEFEKIAKNGGKLDFSKESPFVSITTPKETYFVAHHWTEPGSVTIVPVDAVCVTTGTIYVCRRGEPFDFDVYSMRHSSGEKIIVGLSKDEVTDLGYHHTDQLPEFIKKEAPEWVTVRIEDAKRKDLKESYFI